MIAAWLVANPGRALILVLVVALFAGLAVSRLQLEHARSGLTVAVADLQAAQAAAAECSAGTQRLQDAAEEARRRAAQALAQARAASATRQPQIEALATAEQAGGALTCGDAVERVRDALR
jgi:peptidoglycan hydrolase CwlO-like protein